MSGINLSHGSTIVLDFIRGGEEHRMVSWTSDPTLFKEWAPCADFRQWLREKFEESGAEVLAIKTIEAVEVCFGSK